MTTWSELRRRNVLRLAALVLLAACSEDDSAPPVQLPNDALPGVYGGTFPCDGCPGIPTTLWLRADGRFFFEQQYPANQEREAMTVHSLGRWSRGRDDGVIELKGAGPQRRFVPADSDTLLMKTDSDLEHRLVRDPAAPAFTASIRMAGTMRLGDGVASFTECRSGLTAPVKSGQEFRRFLHQYRSTVARGQPALVELAGRYSWSADGNVNALTIDRFITVKPGDTC